MSMSGLGVQVELGPICVVRDEKGKFTTYTLNFRIAEETHTFTSRYAKLYKFHESLLKNEDFQKSFGYNPPDFPPKSWFTDFTKPKHYKKRANKILKYFKILTGRPSVLRNKQFQKGIDLPSNLQKLIKQIAKASKQAQKHGKQAQKHTKQVHSPDHRNHKDRSNRSNKHKSKSSSRHDHKLHISSRRPHSSMEYFEKMEQYSQNGQLKHNNKYNHTHTAMQTSSSRKNLEILLKDLEGKTDEMFVDIIDGEGFEMKEHIDQLEYHEAMVDDMYLFQIEQVLPKHLLHTMDTKPYENKLNATKIEQLFQLMDENDMNDIDDISLDIRDAIITACEISVN
eukprot:81054_1